MIPTGAQKIIAFRAKGLKPTEMILVSFIGNTGEPNYTVYATPDRDYDWTWTRDLQLCIYAKTGIDWSKAAMSILKANPQFLGVWDAGRNEGAELWTRPAVADIAKPKNQWRWILDYIPWTPAQNWRFACN